MKRINFNIKDRKILYVILVIVLVSVFTLSIVYAALNAILTIQGSAQISSAEWDVHFDNVNVTNGSISGDNPRITSATTAIFSTTLNMPGDFYEFTIDVVNDGSIDAMIENITKTPTLSESQSKYLKYEITYQNGESITTKQLVEKNSFVRLKVRLEYRSDITSSNLPTSSETLNLGLQLNYTQSDGSGSSVLNNGIDNNIIEFTIIENGISSVYEALENMSWDECMSSGYCKNTTFACGDMYYNNQEVYSSDLIIPNGVYTYIYADSCGGGLID